MDLKLNINCLNCVYPPPKCGLNVLEPVQVHVFFRHGDRTPTPIQNASVDADLWAIRVQERPPQLRHRTDYKHQEFPWGQLTKKGKEQALGLGEWLRKYYLDILKISDQNLPSSIHFRSTNYERTHLTGWYVLNGLLGSSEAAACIPVDMRENKTETLADTGEYRRVSAIVKEHMDGAMKPVKQPDGKIKPSEINVLFEKLKAGVAGFLGLEPDRVFNWLTMILAVDALVCAAMHGDNLPESVSTADLYAVTDALGEQLMYAFEDKEFMRLGMGRLVREIVEAISQYLASSPKEVSSLYLYSGHDATIMALSAALGASVKEWPDYCSNIIIELLKSADLSEQYFVRVLYNGVEVPLTVFSGPDHATKSLLTLDEFLEQASHVIISEEEFQSACQQTPGVSSNVYEDMRVEQATQA